MQFARVLIKQLDMIGPPPTNKFSSLMTSSYLIFNLSYASIKT